MKIRYAVEADLPQIVAIYNAAIPSRLATADLEPISVASRQQWFHAHQPHEYPIWVMEYQDQVVGWLSLQMFYGRPAYRATTEISLYVSPDHQGQGIGRKLAEYAIAQCPKLGITTLLSFIFGHNQPSLKLFQRLGFEQWGNLPQVAELDGVQRDLVLLGLKVPTASTSDRTVSTVESSQSAVSHPSTPLESPTEPPQRTSDAVLFQ
ncbi:MAG: N-acetyltransferase family protein [Thainema sp.]